ncbi:MAG TPA: hypothetical protein VF144_17450 [Chitinophagaceae bacterium]
MKNCDCHTEINTDGSGQLQRYLKALDPSTVLIDSRGTEDLLVFAKRYAAQIRFYDLPGSNVSMENEAKEKISWKEFFRRDMAVVIASVAITDLYSFKKEFNEVRDKLEFDADPDLFAALFNPILGMLKKIDRWYSIVIPENPLYNDLVMAIRSDLRQQSRNILAYKKQFSTVDPDNPLAIETDDIINKELWGFDQPAPEDIVLYQGDTAEEQIRYAALNVEDIFYSFYSFLSKLINGSGKYLEYAIKKYPGHQPHMALFITFLELFRIVQQQMNGLTARMLNYYYREVLRLNEKPSIPDKAHIVFELAKEVAEHHLEAGTELSAGNDLSGKEQVYKTEDDFVINQAKVVELKTIFIEKDFLYGNEIKKEDEQVVHSIYARPVANSLDGFGEKFTEPDPKWYTFGVGNPEIKEPKNICEAIDLVKKISARKNDRAKIGFAFASPQLLIEGGKRLVQVTFNEATFKIIEKMDDDPFEIWFTGEKDWFRIGKKMSVDEVKDFTKFFHLGIFNPKATLDIENRGAYYLDKEKKALTVYLPVAEPPVIGYDDKLHKKFSYTTSLPVMQIRLNPRIDLTAREYRSMSVENVSLRVKVGSINPINKEGETEDEKKLIGKFHLDGLNKLIIHTENGVQEVGKPFDPYSPYPAKGKFFYVGSTEVFNKPFNPEKGGDGIAVVIRRTEDDKDRPDDTVFHGPVTFLVDVLKRKHWTRLIMEETEGKSAFSQLALTKNILFKLSSPDFDTGSTRIVSGESLPRLPIQKIEEWTPDADKGFLRIINPHATEADMEKRQNQASKFEVAEIYISYDSTLDFLEVPVDEFYHVYPFGNVKVYPDKSVIVSGIDVNRSFAASKDSLPLLPDKEGNSLSVDAKLNLLPQFTYENPYDKYNTGNNAKAKSNYGVAIARMSDTRITTVKKKLKRDKATNDLMLSASGLLDKLEGGANQYSSLAQEEGMLQIGIENLKPLQTISLLFQFAEGSAEEEDKQPPDINWSYLTNNEWRPLKAENIVADGTFGFQTTGIVKISLPDDATDHNSINTDGLHWLCASVTKDSNRIPLLIDVVTQATEVKFQDNDNAQSHFDKAVPAGTISKLIVSAPEVSKVLQPFASFDGKRREIGREFYTRVSERLRHKHRAITPWDYEHIVLDRFPSIYKIKCITRTDPECLCRDQLPRDIQRDFSLKYNADGTFDDPSLASVEKAVNLLHKFEKLSASISSFNADGNVAMATQMANKTKAMIEAGGVASNRVVANVVNGGSIRTVAIKLAGEVDNEDDIKCCGPQVAPGHVLLVPIANLKNRNAVNPLHPKTSRRTLLEIESYLKKITSPFVRIHAKNPVYEQVLVFFRVKFHPQYEIGYYIKKLNEEIVHFLTPWAFDENADVKFGQKVYASSIINFIEERKYVDFITDFNMVVCRDECCPSTKETKQKVEEGDILASVKLESGAGTQIKGALLNKETASPLAGVTVTAGATNLTAVTGNNGEFLIDPGVVHNGTLSFSSPGFDQRSVDILIGQEQEFVFKKEDNILNEWGLSIEKIEKLCGCSNVEYLLQDEMDLPGDVVARPSTARSILVSAPQHIIIPYKEPPFMTPCEKKALSKNTTTIANSLSPHSNLSEMPKPENLTNKKNKETKKIQPGKKGAGKKPNK